jgi:hypothetical protein
MTVVKKELDLDTECRRVSGYKGIWFDLGQKSKFGSKYSGGLGTYTAKHHPLAVYSPEVQKTFFVYGGTTNEDECHLLAMASYYDHQSKTVPKPVVVHDKQGVDDPHDNPSIQIDQKGFLWVYISGRGTQRPGHIYRSGRPYNIQSFEHISEREFTYPQPWWITKKGFLFLFTKYTGVRELYFSKSDPEGTSWSKDCKLAGMGGHYQMSNELNGRIITAFNMHPDGNPDKRTNLYFSQTNDYGNTWTTIDGSVLKLPLTDINCKALVRNYMLEEKLVYLKDIAFDSKGNPVLLYLISDSHLPGPTNHPRTWVIAHWTDDKWVFTDIATSTHNYDMGSLYIESNRTWRIIAPLNTGPQKHGTGGEIVILLSKDEGKTWEQPLSITQESTFNHGYVRRPRNAHDDFYGFWTDGNPDSLSRSQLYFTNKDGNHIKCLPYSMEETVATPLVIND